MTQPTKKLIEQLRDRAYSGKAVDTLCEQAADEIERLQLAIRRLAEQDATLSVCEGNVTVDIDATLIDAERRDIAIAADAYADNDDDPDCARIAATLRSLLARISTT